MPTGNTYIKKWVYSIQSIWHSTQAYYKQGKISQSYPEVFDSIGCFLGLPNNIQVEPSATPKQIPCQPVSIHIKEPFKQEINKMLQAGILKPVYEATPWINSFVLVEGKVKLGKLKLRICLDPINLNIAIVHEPYHFKTQEDIAHLLADTCVITVSDCRKDFLHQQPDEASAFLTTFNTELRRFCYTVMPFGATVVGDVFQHKLDECFGKIKKVIIIADDIMIVGYEPDTVTMTKSSQPCYKLQRTVMWNSIMTNSRTSRMKMNSLVKPIQ